MNKYYDPKKFYDACVTGNVNHVDDILKHNYAMRGDFDLLKCAAKIATPDIIKCFIKYRISTFALMNAFIESNKRDAFEYLLLHVPFDLYVNASLINKIIDNKHYYMFDSIMNCKKIKLYHMCIISQGIAYYPNIIPSLLSNVVFYSNFKLDPQYDKVLVGSILKIFECIIIHKLYKNKNYFDLIIKTC